LGAEKAKIGTVDSGEEIKRKLGARTSRGKKVKVSGRKLPPAVVERIVGEKSIRKREKGISQKDADIW